MAFAHASVALPSFSNNKFSWHANPRPATPTTANPARENPARENSERENDGGRESQRYPPTVRAMGGCRIRPKTIRTKSQSPKPRSSSPHHIDQHDSEAPTLSMYIDLAYVEAFNRDRLLCTVAVHILCDEIYALFEGSSTQKSIELRQ